jgi:hypothetical protein
VEIWIYRTVLLIFDWCGATAARTFLWGIALLPWVPWAVVLVLFVGMLGILVRCRPRVCDTTKELIPVPSSEEKEL